MCVADSDPEICFYNERYFLIVFHKHSHTHTQTRAGSMQLQWFFQFNFQAIKFGGGEPFQLETNFWRANIRIAFGERALRII